MNILLYTIMVLFGLIAFLMTRIKSNKIITYNKINNKDTLQVKNESKKSENKSDMNLSSLIRLPYILYNIIYFKILIVIVFITTMIILIAMRVMVVNTMNLLLFGSTMFIATIYLPRIVIKNIVSKKIKCLLQSLPFFIDITAACVQSGMTIDSALSYSTKKFQLINTDLSLIMSKITKRAEINGLESAIKEFQQCSNETEIKMFCSALQYSISFGSTVYDQLIKLSQDMREMQLLVTEEKNSKLATKMMFPLFVFILIPFVVLVISPSVLELLKYVQTI
ncbi:type II secretion system F family protein [Yersinia pekkanenii]|uniref:Tight adherance operon protein n=1 Tax=Yersinia pekkanenii TaxID=1288385 RepID=A0A0T9P6D1_9GAMM|nr:type II secretion system F family protein [Yersinia pekkanenii]CNH46248.1 putative tight adherance operon protein [Yersinia pekkanenii]CRY67619.1 putative tight adherance operon protein [Yersinia pekkanenii]